MKKLLTILLVSGASLAANAQYFQTIYGSPDREIPRSGIDVRYSAPPGHVFAGATDNRQASFDMTLSRCDVNGLFPVFPHFDALYRLADHTGQFGSKATRVIEINPSGDYLVVGDITTRSMAGPVAIYSARFSPSGTFLIGHSYQLLQPTVSSDIHLTSVRQSITNPNMAIACGYMLDPTSNNIDVLVLNIDILSTKINWANSYSIGSLQGQQDDYAFDLIESPYNPYGVTEIAVVGHTETCGSGDAFFLEVDLNSGALVTGLAQLFKTSGDDHFKSIDIANSNIGGAPDFVVAGYTNGYSINGDYDMWAIKMPPAANGLDWETLIDYNPGSPNDYAFDIIERLNTNGRYEYYVGGYTDQGVFGGDDAVVYKLNMSGAGVGFGQFTYGGSGMDRVVELDQQDVSTPAPGLMTFGVSNSFPGLGNDDIYNVKAYFNGISGCNENIVDPVTTQQSNPPVQEYALQRQVLDSYSITSPFWRDMTLITMCTSGSIPGGDNTRIINPDAQSGSATDAYPNPVSAANPVVKLEYTATADATINVKLVDVNGKVCYAQDISVSAGTQVLSLNFGTELATGVYTLQVDKQSFSITVNK